MPTGRKIAVAAAAALVLLAFAFFAFLRQRGAREGPEPALSAPVDPAGAVPPAVRRKTPAAPETPGQVQAPPVPSPAPLAPAGWTIAGRILRSREGVNVPAAGATVHLKPHPERTRPADRPPPRSVTAGADGSFEVRGVARHAWWHLELDDPESVYLALSFQIREQEREGTKDLGEVLLEPATADLTVRLLGPDDEPVGQAAVLARRDQRDRGRLQELGFSESGRLAEERGQGLYVLARPLRGVHSLGVMAPGYAPASRLKVEIPREEPLLVKLEKGSKISGVVLTSEGKPIGKAEASAIGPGLAWAVVSVTDAAGRFEIGGLGKDKYDLHAGAEGYASAGLEKVPGGSEDQEIRLAPEAVFAGTVAADDDGSPVAGAVVALMRSGGQERRDVEADESGAFTIRKLAAGTYALTAEHPEFAPLHVETVELREAERAEGQALRMTRGLAAVVTVVDAGSGEPIPGAQVYFQREPSGGQRGLRTPSAPAGPDGAAVVKGLDPGTYQLSVSARGYLASKRRSVEIVKGTPVKLTLTLEKGGSIGGRVSEAEGRAVPGAQVTAGVLSMQMWDDGEGPGGFFGSRATTDQEGRFLLPGLQAHPRYEVRVTHASYAPTVIRDIAVERGQATEGVEITLTTGGAISGRVLDPEGAGVARAKVRVKFEEDGRAELRSGMIRTQADEQAETDDQGGFSMSRLRPGTYELKAEAENFEPGVRAGVALSEGQTLENVDLVLGRGGTLAGLVVDTGGRPVPGADVRASSQENRATAVTDAEGRFRLRGLGRQANITVERAGFAMLQSFQVGLSDKEITLTLRGQAKVSGMVRARGRDSFPEFQVATRAADNEAEQIHPMTYTGARGEGSGRFEVAAPEGKVTIHVFVPGFAPARSRVLTLRAGETVEGVTIDLVPGGTVEGTVVLKGSGIPVDGAQLRLMPDGDPLAEGHFGQSGADGSFKLEGLPEQLSDLVAEKNGHPPVKLPGLQIRAGEKIVVKAELEAGVLLSGRITSRGAPARADRIFARRLDGLPGSGQGSLDAQGNYSIQLPGPGTYSISVLTDPRNPPRLTVVVPEGVRELRQDLEIPEGGIHGLVVDAATSRPLAEARVWVITAGAARESQIHYVQADQGGRFSLASLAPGVYRLHAVAEGHAQGRLDGVEPAPGEAPELRLALEEGVPLTFRLLEPSGRPLQDFFPIIRNAAGEPVYLAGFLMAPATNGPLGRVLPGQYKLSFFSRRFAPEHLDLRVETEPVERTVKMQIGGRVTILVEDSRGRPVEGAEVDVRDHRGESMVEEGRMPWRMMEGPLPPSATDARGRLTLSEHVRPGVYRAFATRGAARSPVVSLTVRDGEPAEATLRLPD